MVFSDLFAFNASDHNCSKIGRSQLAKFFKNACSLSFLLVTQNAATFTRIKALIFLKTSKCVSKPYVSSNKTAQNNPFINQKYCHPSLVSPNLNCNVYNKLFVIPD